MPTDEERAEAARILAEPTRPAPQPLRPVLAMFSPDSKPGQELNPEYVEWANRLLRKLVAAAVLLGIEAKPNIQEMNWHAVALGLACRYHPSFKPKKEAGRSRSKYSEARYSARSELLRLFDAHKDRRIGGKSFEAVWNHLKHDPALPDMFLSMRKETVRQEVTIAKKERKVRLRIMADLLQERATPTDYSQFLNVPGRDFVPSPYLFGLRLTKPMGNPD